MFAAFKNVPFLIQMQHFLDHRVVCGSRSLLNLGSSSGLQLVSVNPIRSALRESSIFLLFAWDSGLENPAMFRVPILIAVPVATMLR